LASRKQGAEENPYYIRHDESSLGLRSQEINDADGLRGFRYPLEAKGPSTEGSEAASAVPAAIRIRSDLPIMRTQNSSATVGAE